MSDDSDGESGHFMGRAGDFIRSPHSVFEILRECGVGTFGRVLSCVKRDTGERCAMKVIRRIQRYSDSALIEAQILREINERKAPYVVRMLEYFEFQQHVCISFEQLGPSLYDVLKKNEYVPLGEEFVLEVGRQLLAALAYLHDTCKCVHTDLKLENILLASPEPLREGSPGQMPRYTPRSNSIRIIDFGGATFEDAHHSSIINTRQYRGPEVILGLGWSYPSDIWSAGCILAELLTGRLLFSTHDNLEHLHLMQKVTTGRLPAQMVAGCKERLWHEFFERMAHSGHSRDLQAYATSMRAHPSSTPFSRMVDRSSWPPRAGPCSPSIPRRDRTRAT